MKPYRATLRLLHDYDRALVDVIQFLDAIKHSNHPVRETVDKLLNHSDDLKFCQQPPELVHCCACDCLRTGSPEPAPRVVHLLIQLFFSYSFSFSL